MDEISEKRERNMFTVQCTFRKIHETKNSSGTLNGREVGGN